MFKNNNHSVITGVDIGTDTIKTVTAFKKSEKSDLEVIFQGTQPGDGVRKGVVIRPEKVAENVRILINQAENSSGERINAVYSNINGSHVSTMLSHGTIAVSRADREISQEDIDRAILAAQTINLPSNKEVIDVFPKEFVIDGEKGIKDALGMRGTRLETEVLLLCALSPYFQNLTKAIATSNLQVADIQSSPIAAAEAVLDNKQRDLGVALVDIGAYTTGLAIFEEENLVHTAIFPVGSAHITNDIAIGFRCEIDLAEKIKKEFVACAAKRQKGEKYKRDKIKVSDSLTFSRKMLSGIIEARVSEIFDEVDKELKRASRQRMLPAGIVLTGGGAKLPKLVDFAKKEFKLPCQIGKPQGFIGLDGDPALATVCGLVLRGVNAEEGHGGFPGLSMGKGITDKLKGVFRIFIP